MEQCPERPGEIASLERQVDELRRTLARVGGPVEGLVGRSRAMQEAFRALFSLAELPAAVAIVGEGGTGRRALGAALHALSRRSGPLLEGLSDDQEPLPVSGTALIAGATRASAETQASWAERLKRSPGLRPVLLLSRGAAELELEGRLTRPLAALVAANEIRLAPLRERRDDIPLLVDHFLDELADELTGRRPRVDARALEAMAAHEWPGNIRELRNVVRRARALSDGDVLGLAAIRSVLGGSSALSEEGRDEDLVVIRVGDSMADAERRVIQRTLEIAQGNKRKAAELLELSLKTIYNKVKEYGLEGQFNRRFRKAPRSG